MVRSKGEAPESLRFAEKLRLADKYSSLSASGIIRQLDEFGGKTELRWTESLADHDGQRRDIRVRLNLNLKAETALSWTASLKVGGVRIDCIDHEGGTGWHRHFWSEKAQSAEGDKRPIKGFHERMKRSEFIIRALAEMRVRLNKHDDEVSELPFD